MRKVALCLFVGLLCAVGCSQDMQNGSCGEGMQGSAADCLPLGGLDAGVDAGVGDLSVAVGDPTLSGLSVSGASLSPAFASGTTVYVAELGFLVGSVQVKATTTSSQAMLQINGQTASSGVASAPIAAAAGPLLIPVTVEAAGGIKQSYTVVVVRRPSASDYLKASNSGMLDQLGTSVSLSGDGNTLAVGAVGEASNATGIGGNQADNSAANSGAVYVFVRSGGVWAQQAYVKASNAAANDAFGTSVSLSGDGNTLAVGAIGEASNATGIGGNQADNSAGLSGAVYMFVRSGTVWTQQAYVKASNTGANERFGTSVSLSGDGNTLAVGAPLESSNATGIGGNQADNSAASSGAVYVFVRGGTVWAQQAYVKASNTGASDLFGTSVSLSGDGNTLAVGANGEASNATGVGGSQADNSAADSGAVYVFMRIGTVWTQQAYVKASNTGAGDRFGTSVSLSGDGNTLSVGAVAEASNATGIGGNQADNSAFLSGAVYVFARIGITWTQQAYVKASNSGASDRFGTSVSLSGDGNTLSVGAVGEASSVTGVGGYEGDNSVGNSGAVYIFVRIGTVWTQQAYVKASNTGASDRFGTSVSLSGDGNTLSVGAISEASNATGVGGNQADNSLTASGAAYVYR